MSTDKKLTTFFRRNCYALHLGASHAQTISNLRPSLLTGFSSYSKEGSDVETLSEIDEALHHATLSKLNADAAHKVSIDEFIDKLLDAHNALNHGENQ